MSRASVGALALAMVAGCATAGSSDNPGAGADAGDTVRNPDASPVGNQPDAGGGPGQPDAREVGGRADASPTDNCTPASLSTGVSNRDGLHGVMFDIRAEGSDVVIESFDAVVYSTRVSLHDVELYYRAGSFMGSEHDPQAWTRVGEALQFEGNGPDAFTAIPLDIGLRIPAGQTYGFYLTSIGEDSSFLYRYGTADGQPLESDSHIVISEGPGLWYPFGDFRTTTGNQWAGVVHYATCQ